VLGDDLPSMTSFLPCCIADNINDHKGMILRDDNNIYIKYTRKRKTETWIEDMVPPTQEVITTYSNTGRNIRK